MVTIKPCPQVPNPQDSETPPEVVIPSFPVPVLYNPFQEKTSLIAVLNLPCCGCPASREEPPVLIPVQPNCSQPQGGVCDILGHKQAV